MPGRIALVATREADVDARLAPAVLQAAIATLQPPASPTNHSDRGWQYDAKHYRAEPAG